MIFTLIYKSTPNPLVFRISPYATLLERQVLESTYKKERVKILHKNQDDQISVTGTGTLP